MGFWRHRGCNPWCIAPVSYTHLDVYKRQLYYGAVQTMPFARPHFDELLQAIDFAIDKNYPARGEYTGPG